MAYVGMRKVLFRKNCRAIKQKSFKMSRTITKFRLFSEKNYKLYVKFNFKIKFKSINLPKNNHIFLSSIKPLFLT